MKGSLRLVNNCLEILYLREVSQLIIFKTKMRLLLFSMIIPLFLNFLLN